MWHQCLSADSYILLPQQNFLWGFLQAVIPSVYFTNATRVTAVSTVDLPFPCILKSPPFFKALSGHLLPANQFFPSVRGNSRNMYGRCSGYFRLFITGSILPKMLNIPGRNPFRFQAGARLDTILPDLFLYQDIYELRTFTRLFVSLGLCDMSLLHFSLSIPAAASTF